MRPWIVFYWHYSKQLQATVILPEMIEYAKNEHRLDKRYRGFLKANVIPLSEINVLKPLHFRVMMIVAEHQPYIIKHIQ